MIGATATFYATVTFDRSQMTLDMLDSLIELLRERGYPTYEPKAARIVVRYEVAVIDDPGTALDRAREELLMPDCSYEARQAAILAFDIAELRDEVEREVGSYGFGIDISWSREVPS
jgi:hypothetical protein